MPSAAPLTLHEAAEALGVHYMTVYRWVRTGRLRASREGTEWRVAPADLERARARGRTGDGAARGRPRSRRATADRLRRRMVAGDEPGAWAVIEETLTAGASPTEVHLDVLGPALEAIGDAWANGTTTVGEEHRASVVATRLLGRMGPLFARRGRKRGAVLLGAPAGEDHALPGSLLADVLRGAGFEVVDLGANTPAESFVEAARSATRLVAVLIGVTTPGNDAAVRKTVAALHDAGIAVPVLVGGRAVADAAYVSRLGADGWSGRDGSAALAALDAPASSAAGRAPG